MIEKTIKGDLTKEEADGKLVFEITTGEGENLKYVALDDNNKPVLTTDQTGFTIGGENSKFVYNADDDKYILTINDIITGSYTVTETIYDVNGYECAVKSTVVEDGTEVSKKETNGQQQTVNVLDSKDSVVSYEDDYDKQEASLDITKTFEGLEGDALTEAAAKGHNCETSSYSCQRLLP